MNEVKFMFVEKIEELQLKFENMEKHCEKNIFFNNTVENALKKLYSDIEVCFARALVGVYDKVSLHFEDNLEKRRKFEKKFFDSIKNTKKFLLKNEESNENLTMINLEKIEDKENKKKVPSILKLITEKSDKSQKSEKSNFMLSSPSKKNTPDKGDKSEGVELEESQYIFLTNIKNSQTDLNFSKTSIKMKDNEGNYYCKMKKIEKNDTELNLTKYF